jgi:hypothetical protein
MQKSRKMAKSESLWEKPKKMAKSNSHRDFDLTIFSKIPKIIFPSEIAACADIIYGYLAKDNDDCDYYNLPFQFRVRFLLLAMARSFDLWTSPQSPAFPQFGLDLPLLPIVVLERVQHATAVWWAHALANDMITSTMTGHVINLAISQDAAIGTSQRRWIS